MTTLATPWHGGRRAARRRQRAATFAVAAAFLLAAVVVVGVATPVFGVMRDAVGWPGNPVPDGMPVDEPAAPVDVDTDGPDVPADEGEGPAEPVDDLDADGTDPGDADESGIWGPEGTADLEDVQRRLQELGYLLGEGDGVKGQQTVAAIMAFQRVNDLQVDGVVGPLTLTALGDPVEPVLGGGPGTRLEVDLDRQLLHVVDAGERVVTLHVSSGNGGTYRTASGGTAYARTPVGEFVVERRIHGVRTSRLGVLYDPLYFYGGFAIHGSPSVPAHPASHGCVRVTRADGRWLIDHIEDGTAVHLHGGTHVFTPSGRA